MLITFELKLEGIQENSRATIVSRAIENSFYRSLFKLNIAPPRARVFECYRNPTPATQIYFGWGEGLEIPNDIVIVMTMNTKEDNPSWVGRIFLPQEIQRPDNRQDYRESKWFNPRDRDPRRYTKPIPNEHIEYEYKYDPTLDEWASSLVKKIQKHFLIDCVATKNVCKHTEKFYFALMGVSGVKDWFVVGANIHSIQYCCNLQLAECIISHVTNSTFEGLMDSVVSRMDQSSVKYPRNTVIRSGIRVSVNSPQQCILSGVSGLAVLMSPGKRADSLYPSPSKGLQKIEVIE